MYTLAKLYKGKEVVIDLLPMTHQEACTMKSKFSNPAEIYLKEV